MSSGERISREKALVLAEGVMNWLESNCEKIEVVGSVRREKETVGDIEIVCLPHNSSGLIQSLEALIENGSIQKKLYQQKRQGKTVSVTRWGERLKVFVIADVTCELHIADQNNYGYLKWLGTGPSDGNTFVMTMMKQEKAAMRFKDGYGWICKYNGDAPSYETKLHLPDEAAVFHALGLGNVIEPKFRHMVVYKNAWKGVLPSYMLNDFKADEPRQMNLFD